ncbi:glutathione S-transferase N-terminal domain-containing protein [Candidatus Kaiserbacteria bacterium]|nr:glutathione S-transferase N-terminal domain-containing protein [Candidatus Kaiserbacteria bacterium]
MALKKLEDLNLEFEEKNVADEGVVDELIALGGKKQEPFLVDSETGKSMYESDAITEYLQEQYGSKDTV